MKLQDAIFLVGAIAAGMLILVFGLPLLLFVILFVIALISIGVLFKGIGKLFLLFGRIAEIFDWLSEKIFDFSGDYDLAFYVEHTQPLRLLGSFIASVARTFIDQSEVPTLLHASVHFIDIIDDSPFVWIKALILLAPRRLLSQDRKGRTPLHVFLSSGLCCHHPRGIEMMKSMIQHGHGSLQIADSDGLLPLHVAAWRGLSELTKMLLEAYPPAARVFAPRVGHGVGLPLHLACKNNACLETIQLLVEAYPLSVCERRPKCNDLPHQLTTSSSNRQYIEGRYNDLVRAEAYKVLEHHGCPRCVGFHMLDFISLMPIALSSLPPAKDHGYRTE